MESRRLSPEDNNFKRRMKTPVQLEALERVYAGLCCSLLVACYGIFLFLFCFEGG